MDCGKGEKIEALVLDRLRTMRHGKKGHPPNEMRMKVMKVTSLNRLSIIFDWIWCAVRLPDDESKVTVHCC